MQFYKNKLLLNLDKLKSGIRYRVKSKLSSYPRLFIPLYRFVASQENVNCLITPETEIVIEGFPRSANTFAVIAFEMAQKRLVKIAHHLHAEAQILEGVKRGLPIIVVIREPVAAIRSLMTRHPEIEVNWAFNRYISFYSAIEKVVDKLVIAGFDDVVGDYGNIIRMVNGKFGTDFIPFEHTDENTTAVFNEISRINERLYGGNELFIARPSNARRETSNQLDVVALDRLKKRAMNIYDNLCALGDK